MKRILIALVLMPLMAFSYVVSYNANGATSGTAPDSQTKTSDVALTLASNSGSLAKTGYVFDGWNTAADGSGTSYAAGGTYTANASLTLYAKWTPDPFSVAGGVNATPVGVTTAVNSDAAHSGDGLNSLKLGGIGLLADGQMAGIEWSVTGPGILAFDWKVSSEQDYDVLSFYEAGVGETNLISGAGQGWAHVSIEVLGDAETSHTFRWEYEKDIGERVGDDAGWVDAITWTPAPYPLTVVNGSGSGVYAHGSLVGISASDFAGKQFYRWTGDVEFVTSAASATTTVTMPDFPISIAATYLVPLTVNDGAGSGWHPEGSAVSVTAAPDPLYMEFAGWTGDAAAFLEDASSPTTILTMPTAASTLTATYRDSIARVSGSYGRTYTQSGTENGISTDAAAGAPSGNAAVKLGGTGVVPDNGFAAFETIVEGSGSITFWWKSTSEVNDHLRCLVDGVQVAAISGTKTPWTWVSNRVEGAGVEHTLRWEYVKNGSAASSTDAGWVDDIVWMPDYPDPKVTPAIVSFANAGQTMAIEFMGERGVEYHLQTNSSLSAAGWGYFSSLTPSWLTESNGLHRFEITPPVGQENTLFYRVVTPTVPEGMALIPAGSFQMGDNLGGGWSGEVPVHTVYVSAFYMDKTEVTWAKWQEVRTWAAAHGYDIGSVGAGKADNHPVHSVSWHDCVKWLNARSQKEGLTPCYTVGGATYKTGNSVPDCNWSAGGYRLPTEAEWEKAARGGLSGRRFPWGDTIQHARANYYSDSSYSYDTSPTRGCHPSYAAGGSPYTSPAGAFEANGYGLYDMSGNVWEWCWDWYGSAYYSSSPSSDPRGPSSGSDRVIRGGSWDVNASGCRSSYRGDLTPTSRYYVLGFRPVRRAP